jgi:hypothetical protein
MNDADSPPADAAWVTIDTPLEPDALAEFCRDVERLYRINPYLEFRFWRAAGPGRVAATFRNLSIKRDFELQLMVERASARAFTVHYDRGIRRSTHFEIEPAPGGSRLTITDDYIGAATQSPVDTTEVDKSLHAWGTALHDYLRREARWGKYAPWRWYMRRVWTPMKPSARRITFILIVVTLVELALFGLVMAIYWIEYGG